MKKVSRSFALVVSYLEQPLRDYLAAAYLVAMLPFAVAFYLESTRPRAVWLWALCVGLQAAFLVAETLLVGDEIG